MPVPVVVTGGAGYIGSHICKALSQAGFLPVSIDNLSRGHAALVRFGPLEQIDILDTEAVSAALSRYQPAAVIHCAGCIAIGESTADPALYYRQNVTGTLQLLQAMQDAGVNKIIFSSSCAVHGLPETQPIREDAPYAPISPYGNTKMMAELAIRDYASAYGLHYLVFRYFNACGADPDGEIGECHEPETHLIPLAIQAVLSGKPLHLFGTDYPTPDGTAIRDYIHVSDIAEAHLLGLNYMLEGGASDIFNIGQGLGHSVREIIEATAQVTGRDVPTHVASRRAGDTSVLLADTAKICEKLGFAARHSTLHAIISSAYHWEREKERLHD